MRRIVILLLLAGSLAAQESVLLVLQKGASSLAFYKPTGELITTIPVGQHPHEMVLSADRRYLYTSDNGTMRIEQAGVGGNTVSIIDLKTRKKVGEINLGKYHRPHGLSLDPKTGRLAVSTELPDQLVIADAAKRSVARTYDTKAKTSHMVTLSKDGGTAYVSNSSSANVSAMSLATGEVKLIPVGERPEGSAISGDGKHVYIANRESAKISIIDTTKNEVSGEIKTGNGPVRLAVAPDGKVVYAAMHDKKVEIADPVSRKVLRTSAALAGPLVSLHLSDDGKLAFTSAEEIDTVYVLSVPDLKLVRTFKTAAGAHPDPVMMVPAQ